MLLFFCSNTTRLILLLVNVANRDLFCSLYSTFYWIYMYISNLNRQGVSFSKLSFIENKRMCFSFLNIPFKKLFSIFVFCFIILNRSRTKVICKHSKKEILKVYIKFIFNCSLFETLSILIKPLNLKKNI